MRRWLSEYSIPLGIGVVLVAVIVLFVCLSIRDEHNWDRFRKQHECKVVRREAGSTTTGFANGKTVVVTTPGKVTWRCDDGVEYVR